MTDFSNPDANANRFAPPRAEVADPQGTLELAGRGTRLGAVLLDSVICTIVVFVLMFALGMGYSSRITTLMQSGRDQSEMMWAMWGIMATSFGPGWLAVIALQGWSLHRYGGTLGKKLLGIRIVRVDGSRAGFVRLFFLRAGSIVVVSMIPFLGGLIALVDTLLIFRDSRQCLHDSIADTIVIRSAAAA